jgi:nucleoside-diphosphate-sugar epimerase
VILIMTSKSKYLSAHICVIGGSGFIGTRLCQRLQRSGIPFTIIDIRTSARFPEFTRIADICDPEAVEKAIEPGSIIVHLAAEHRDDVVPISKYDQVNTGGTKNICIAAGRRDVVSIVFTSSVAVYGFAQIGTAEDGVIMPFNSYGRTKYEAEEYLRSWQREVPLGRTLSIVRPTVVFGEQNRGNVYNLLRQIASRRFIMVGDGKNRKSLAYVENIAAFLEFSLQLTPGIYTTNYVDKPDFTMNEFVAMALRALGRNSTIRWRLPVPLALMIGYTIDMFGKIFKVTPAISSLRVKKFCADSVYSTAANQLGFQPPVEIVAALEQTIKHEFIESHHSQEVFFSE